MSKPTSLKTEPWTSFGTFSTNAFNDDFVHKDHLTTKIKSVSNSGATVNIKENISLVKEGTGSKTELKDELKYWFPVNGNSWIFTRLNRTHAKIHYDNGVTQFNGQKLNFYGSLLFERNLNNPNLRIGVSSISPKCTSDNRLKVSESNTVAYHKTQITHNEFRVGLLGVVDITNKVLAKKQLLLGYLQNSFEVYLKAIQDWDDKSKDFSNLTTFSQYSATALWRRNPEQRFGLEVTQKGNILGVPNFAALAEYQHNPSVFLKGKFTDNFTASVLLKKKVDSLLTVSGSAELPLNSKDKPKFGVQFDLNI